MAQNATKKSLKNSGHKNCSAVAGQNSKTFKNNNDTRRTIKYYILVLSIETSKISTNPLIEFFFLKYLVDKLKEFWEATVNVHNGVLLLDLS